MRMQLSLLRPSILLICSACTSDAAEIDPPVSSGPSAVGETGASDARPVDAGQSDGQASLPPSDSPRPGDAGSQGAAPARDDAGAQPAAIAQSDAGSQSTCPSKYSTAMHVRVDISWPDTIGYWGGKGVLQAWMKVTYTATANGTTLESSACAVALPSMTATPLLDEAQFVYDIPERAFDQPSMPRFAGRLERRDGMLVIDLGATVLGASLGDPDGAWPFRGEIPLVDHDGDGKPGITAIPRQTPPFVAPPINLTFTKYSDAVYVASRMKMRISAAREGCREPTEGSVEPLLFDFTTVGCHVQDAGECTDSEANLVHNNGPMFSLGSQGKWRSVPISDDASCADVRNALPEK